MDVRSDAGPSASAAVRLPFFDLHCDTLDRLALHACMPEAGFMDEDASIPAERMNSLADNDAHIALNRMGGYAWCQCFASFIPDGLGADGAWGVFAAVRDFLARECSRHPQLVEQVRDARDVDSVVASGRCAAMLTVEGASFFDGTAGLSAALDRLAAVAEAGVKMVTLTWNGKNALASGHDTTDGLSSFGCDMVRAMEERRIVIDVSHLNDVGFDEFARMAKRPFAASHSNSRAVCGHRRNLTDDQFRAIRDAGGIVGLNFCRKFLREDGADATRDDILRHLDRFLTLGGEHSVALGSDYDGCDVPSWLEPADRVGTLYGLFAREFGADIADAVCFGNARAFFVRNETL